MNIMIRKNLANFIVVARVLIVLCALGLLSAEGTGCRLGGVALLAVAALLDWADGRVAHALNTSSKVGGLLDTMGDRITENLLFIFFAYKRIIPLYVPLFYAPRSFAADFIRTLSFSGGLSTFEVNTSAWGRRLVASPFSRALYLAVKFGIFISGGLVLALENMTEGPGPFLGGGLRRAATGLAALAVAFSLLRFIFLVYDSRTILEREFLS